MENSWKALSTAWIVAAILLTISYSTANADRSVISFCDRWRFSKGEQPENVKQIDFDDSAWQDVTLPHDWAISGPFNPEEHGYAGKLPWKGVGWYRKTFSLDPVDQGKQVYLDFDGVMAFPKVYINGELAGEWDYGYMSFRVDATPYIHWNKPNIVAVQADTRRHGTRWYPGAGIYRKVVLTLCEPIHIGHWSTFVSTPNVGDDAASVRVRSTVENHLSSELERNLEISIYDPQGRRVAEGQWPITLHAGNSHAFDHTFVIPNPRRWDINNPALYSVKVLVWDGKRIGDTDIVSFGIRTFAFTANDGFHLNGRRVQLYGVNLHHDHGPLGAAFYTRAMERQLEIMRDMGCNAIRTSHNPPAPELLDLCDRMGFVVWNECFDKWDATADRVNGEPLEEYGHKQIRQFVMRDRNHPSIVTWSIGNEITNQPQNKEGKSPERVKFMSDFVRRYDPTRPVTLGCFIPNTADQPILDALDLTGWNYDRRYARMRERYPEKPLLYSESASALSTRGFYELPLPTGKTQFSKQKQVDSYDHNSARWSDIPEKEFERMVTDSYMAGEFVWTGFDYLGEPTPFDKDARSSYFGIVDLCGMPKDRFFLYRSYWRPETTTIHILPHWNWPERIGQNVPVYVYTNGDSAELFLNGRSLGIRRKSKEIADSDYYAVLDKYRLRWLDVVYEPGELKAVAYQNGRKIGEAFQRTAGEPAALRLTPDRTHLAATGSDLSYIQVEAVDARGTLCPLAGNEVRFEIEGPAEIAGIDNGNPLSLESFQVPTHHLFNGKAMLVLRSVPGKSGKIVVTVSSEGLKGQSVYLHSQSVHNE